MKLDDRNMKSFSIKRVFPNLLIIEFNFPDFMKIHLVFHVNLFQHAVQNLLSDQISESRDFVVIEEDERI